MTVISMLPRYRQTAAACAVSAFISFIAVVESAAQPVEFVTPDSVRIFGDYYPAGEDDGPVILLFHQGGANGRAEYGPLVGKLNAEGYSALSVDQRSGGDRLGGTNRTVEALGDREFGYCEALPDLEATLDYALEQDMGSPLIVWGSSYSAALVFFLAERRPEDVDAVLAFSPASGGPMADCNPNDVSVGVEQPVLALRPGSEMQHASVAAQLALFEEQGHQTYVAPNGVHGSSMLNADRSSDSDETWEVVLEFLRSVE